MSDCEQCKSFYLELERLRRLVPNGTYTLNVAHEQEIRLLREHLDDERANVEMLKTHVETLREASQSAAREVMRLRAERDALAGKTTSIEQNVGALLDLYHARMIESEHQEKLAWERAAEKDRAYGDALAELDEERANVEMLVDCVETLRKAWKSASDKAQQLNERLNMSKPAVDG